MAGPIDTPLGARLFAFRHEFHQDKVVLLISMQDEKDTRHAEVLLNEQNVDDLVLALLNSKKILRRR